MGIRKITYSLLSPFPFLALHLGVLSCFTSNSSELTFLRWRKSAPLPEARAGYAAGLVDGKVVIAGGTYWEGSNGNWTRKLFTARTHAFDPRTQTWQRLPDAPVTLGYAASATVGNRLFVFGGYTGSNINSKIYVLQKSGPRYDWKIFGDMPENRVFAGAVTVGSSIYLLGGTLSFEPFDAAGTCCTSKTATNSLMVLDTRHPIKGWQRLAPFPGAKRWLFAMETDGRFIWMFGGVDHQNPNEPTRFAEVMRYKISEGTWEHMNPLPQATRGTDPLTAVFARDRIMLISFARKIWELNLSDLKYRAVTPLPEEVFVDKYLWVADRIIGAGGENKLESSRRRSEWTFIGEFK